MLTVWECLQERLLQEPEAVGKHCDNALVNAAISHYVSMAEREAVPIRVSTNIPSDLSIGSMDLAIVISNLMENAILASKKLDPDRRYVKVSARYKKQLLLEIENA